MTRVFPDPAPARINTGPSPVVTASRCCGLSCERNSVIKIFRTPFKHTHRNDQTLAHTHDLQSLMNRKKPPHNSDRHCATNVRMHWLAGKINRETTPSSLNAV